MINDTNFFFEDIHIEKFGKLEKISLKNARKLNFIYSGINGGKTTFLEAVKVMLLPLSECRVYNYYNKKHCEKGYFYFKQFFGFSTKTEISWTAQNIKFYDRLIGGFDTDGKFLGYGYYQFVNDNLKIKKFDGTALNFGKQQPAFSDIWNYSGNKCDFYDCLCYKENTNFFDDENSYMKDYIIDFISLYNEDITDIFVKDGIIYVMSDEKGEIPAYVLGDFIYSAIVFYKFIAGCREKVILIDNFDSMLNGISDIAYIEMFLGIIEKLPEKNVQFFITVKDAKTLKIFFDILHRNKRRSQMSYICLDKKSQKEILDISEYAEKENENITD